MGLLADAGHNPTDVAAVPLALIALIAFPVNAVSAVVLRDGSEDLNMRAALLHMIGDAAASLGVAAAGLVILVTGGFEWLDPTVSLGIALLIAIQAWGLVRQRVDVLLESAPKDLDPEALNEAMSAIDGVEEVHDRHVWSLSSTSPSSCPRSTPRCWRSSEPCPASK